MFDEQTSCFHLEVFPSPGDLLKHDAHIPHMSHVQRPDVGKNKLCLVIQCIRVTTKLPVLTYVCFAKENNQRH